MATIIEEFASQLRQLKERSGHSYGVLASRLHVSTSTLHRYCNGAAVPGDYAPVERFARLCGAKPDELVTLHRRWLLADAARRQDPDRAPTSRTAPIPPPSVTPPTSATTKAPTDSPTSTTSPTASAERSAAPPVDAPEPAAPEPDAPEAAAPEAGPADSSKTRAAQPDRAPTGLRGGMPGTASAATGGPEAATDTSQAAAVDSKPTTPIPQASDGDPQEDASATPLPAPVQAGGGRSARRPRRTRVVLGATAAIAAIAVAAAVVPMALHSHAAGDTPAAATLPAATAPANGTAMRSASPAAASAPVSASASASASASVSASASARTRPAPSTAAADTRSPVEVSVLSDNWDTQCDQWFLLTQQPGRVPPPPSLQETAGWANALGAVPAGDLRLQLTAQGAPGQPVVLHALYVRVVGTRPAPKGNGYTTGSGCGGGLDPAAFDVDLDASEPRAQAVPGTVGGGEKAVISNFPFQVSSSESQVINVDAHTEGQDVSWYLELLWSCGDRQGTLRVDDHGRPFRTVGLKGDPAYFYNGTKWAPTTVG